MDLADELLWPYVLHNPEIGAGKNNVCAKYARGSEFAAEFHPSDLDDAYAIASSADLYDRLKIAVYTQGIAVDKLRLLR